VNNQFDECPWCKKKVRLDGTSGMEPVLDDGQWWHQGCVADVTRASREIPQMQEEAQREA
jgi:hypothetical protein